MTTMSDEWKKMKEKFPDAVVFCKEGDEYVCYGQDATTVARIINVPVIGDVNMLFRFPQEYLEDIFCQVIRAGKQSAIITWNN